MTTSFSPWPRTSFARSRAWEHAPIEFRVVPERVLLFPVSLNQFESFQEGLRLLQPDGTQDDVFEVLGAHVVKEGVDQSFHDVPAREEEMEDVGPVDRDE